MKCVCGSRDIDFQESSGHAICCVCGKIIEENTIVSSLEFEETGDRSHVVGQFISADGIVPIKSGSRVLNRYIGSGESREITLANARRAIHQVASTLRLPTLYIDKAYRLYSRALQMRFMYGRQQTHIVATCLYTICRIEKSPHLLIDFSDALQVNVYVIGKAFLHFSRLLNLQQQIKVIDPALYLHRFALRLDLGDKFTSVNNTALRIVTRMKKDWILTGRRPDGICAVALLISMRCHGIEANQTDIAKIFKISIQTLRQRLDDFRSTPAAQLTIQQFNSILPLSINESDNHVDKLDFDPPSFIRNQVNLTSDENSLMMISFAFCSDSIDVENEHIYDENSNKVDFNGVMIDVPLPVNKKRKMSLKKVIEVTAREQLYDSIYNDFNEYTQITPAIENFDSVLNVVNNEGDNDGDLANVLSNEEMDSYILSDQEKEKRSAIFEKSFRSLLDERKSRKESLDKNKSTRKTSKHNQMQSNNIQSSVSRIISDSDKRSKKINYDALKIAFDGDNLINPSDITQRNANKSSFEQLKNTKTLKSGFLSSAMLPKNDSYLIKPNVTDTVTVADSSTNAKNTSNPINNNSINNSDIKAVNQSVLVEEDDDDEELMYEVEDYEEYYDDVE